MTAARRLVLSLVPWPLLLGASAACAQTPAPAEKPLLSEVIRTALDAEGEQAARARFAEIVPDRKDDFDIDPEAFGLLASGYVQAGDMARAQVVFDLMTELYADMYDAATPAGWELPREPAPSTLTPAPAMDDRPPAPEAGPARTDLGRFHGIYRSPDETRQAPQGSYFITQTCEGILQFGAMWGDVAPWVMRSEGETSFVQAFLQPFEEQPIRIEFEVDGDGRALAMVHTFGGAESRAERLGGLPDGWERDCP